jgi:hypothetical protein
MNLIHNPLNWVAQAENPEMMAFLLKSGAHAGFLTLTEAIANSGVHPGYPHKAGSEKTIDALIRAGAFKGISEDEAAGYLLTAFFSGNPVTLRQLLDAGLSPRSKRTEPPSDEGKTAIEMIKDAYSKLIGMPESRDLKPLLDMVEAADAGAGAKAGH